MYVLVSGVVMFMSLFFIASYLKTLPPSETALHFPVLSKTYSANVKWLTHVT